MSLLVGEAYPQTPQSDDSRPTYANDDAFRQAEKLTASFDNPYEQSFALARLVYRMGHPEYNRFPGNHASCEKDFQDEPFARQPEVYKPFTRSEILFAASEVAETRIDNGTSPDPQTDLAISAFARYYLQKAELPGKIRQYPSRLTSYLEYGRNLGYTDAQIATSTATPEAPKRPRLPDDLTTANFMSVVRFGIE